MRRLLKRLKWIIFICAIFSLIIYAGTIILLDGMNIIDAGAATGSSSNINTAITDEELKELIKKSDSEIWQLLTGTAYDSKPTLSQVPESLMEPRITDLTVPVRTANGDSTTVFQVNQALAGLFTAFFKDLYDQCPDFYVSNSGGYVFKDVNNGTTGAMSAHAVGAAVDINDEYNPWQAEPYTKEQYNSLGEPEKHYVIYYDSPMVQIAKKYTLSWGGFWTRKDGMHFSFIGDWTRARTLQEYGIN